MASPLLGIVPDKYVRQRWEQVEVPTEEPTYDPSRPVYDQNLKDPEDVRIENLRNRLLDLQEQAKETEQRYKSDITDAGPDQRKSLESRLENFRKLHQEKLLQTESEIGKQQQLLIDKKVGRSKQREQFLQENLTKTQEVATEAITNRLNDLLADVGYQANVARQLRGAQAQALGLGRSSFAERGYQDIALQEQIEGGRIRIQGAESASRIKRNVEDQRQALKQQQEQLSINRNLSELKSFEQLGFAMEQSSIEEKYQKELLQMELDAREKSFFHQLLGGIASGAAGLLGGIL